MTKFAEYFATVSNGKIVMLTNAYPAHELLENQIALTPQEHKILNAEHDLARLRMAISAIEYKLGELKK